MNIAGFIPVTDGDGLIAVIAFEGKVLLGIEGFKGGEVDSILGEGRLDILILGEGVINIQSQGDIGRIGVGGAVIDNDRPCRGSPVERDGVFDIQGVIRSILEADDHGLHAIRVI